MNKRVIWIIVGLMSVAVIGVIWSQMRVVLDSIESISEKFDSNVQEALVNVADRLEKEEKKEYLKYTTNGYSVRRLQNSHLNLSNSNILGQFDTHLDILGDLSLANSSLEQIFLQLTDDDFCPSCRMRKGMLGQHIAETETVNSTPLGERVNPERIRELLDQELAKWSITEQYNFGVYSNQTQSWLFVNDHFLYDEEKKSRTTIPGIQNPPDSKPYETTLFPRSSSSSFPPGFLVVQFPQKSSFIWSSLRLNLLGTIFFAAIILGCFAYSVNVIFQQKKISEVKTDFINNMTHEFKTPIATISLAADSISSPMISGSPEKIKRFAKIIKQENKRMNSQVEKVLQMALLDKKEFSLKWTEINLHDIIYRAVENISLQAEQRDGVVNSILEATNPIIIGDVTHVSNIINNLLDNANKYSPEKPEISVFTRNVSRGVEIVIKDNGIGMSKEARKHIFDKFYRVHTGDLHDVKGFGLGLSYVKAMMLAHKGQIDVKSELGKGSSFILFFPFGSNSNN